MNLRDLGPYRIERSEDYSDCIDGDKSYCEIIRVKGSRTRGPCFTDPSHLFKYSDTELALYLKDRKNNWKQLGKILGLDVEISDPEIIMVFEASKFPQVSRIIPFVRKALRKKPMTETERSEMIERLSRARSRRLSEMNQKGVILKETYQSGLITLETFDNASVGGLS